MVDASPQDRELVDRARRGDGRAFGLLVQAHQDAVFRLCARHAGVAGAEDLAQDTFLRAFVHHESIDPAQNVRSWLLSIAHRLCIDRFRTRRDFAPLDADAHAAPEADIEGRLDARASLTRVEAVMAQLPAGQREALALYHVEDMAYADIARTLGVPVGTVMSWLHRGREKLRRVLSEEAA